MYILLNTHKFSQVDKISLVFCTQKHTDKFIPINISGIAPVTLSFLDVTYSLYITFKLFLSYIDDNC